MRAWFGVAALLIGAAGAVEAQKPVVRVAAQGGDFATVQAAVDSAGEKGLVVKIAPGTYREKLHIDKPNIWLMGMGKKPEDVVLVYGDSAKMAGGTGKSGSVSVSGDSFAATNLTIQNDFEKVNGRVNEGSQAVALLLTSDNAVLSHVRLLGYQDTLYASSKSCHGVAAKDAVACQASRQLFEDCYIEGHVDYIFGDAKAMFKNCELHGMAHQIVTITAQSKPYPQEDSGYLFWDCTITAEDGVGKHSFGRPWREYARVYFVNTTVTTKLDPPGWMEWGGRLATSDYEEFNTHTADGKRVDVSQRIGSKQMTKEEAAKLSVAGWLNGWKDPR